MPISEFHVGVKGMMGALYLNDVTDITRRGHRCWFRANGSACSNDFRYAVFEERDGDVEQIAGGNSPNTHWPHSAWVRAIR